MAGGHSRANSTSVKGQNFATEPMSARNFYRVYSEVMGTTPAKAVAAMRIDRAQDLLETTSKSLKQIAGLCGFGSEDRMRRAFQHEIKTTPLDYRRSFQAVAPL